MALVTTTILREGFEAFDGTKRRKSRLTRYDDLTNRRIRDLVVI
jgi:hypothetical protein